MSDRTRNAALALLAAGAAGFALARVAGRPAPKRRRAAPSGQAHRVVVAGCGFGGLDAATALAGRRGIDLTVIDAHNHHLFQPLLYQVATAALSPADIAVPIRGLVPVSPAVRVLVGEVTGVDVGSRHVICDGDRVPYDELIVATGSKPSYFGHGGWAGSAPGLKTLRDALHLRQTILEAFERASRAEGDERRRLLTFVLIGGGPTGVEMAGAIAELARDMLARDYGLPDAHARIVLVEAADRILASFPDDLAGDASRALVRMGVEIRAGARVTKIEPGAVHLGGGVLSAATIIWTAGTEATPVAQWLGVEPGHGGRVQVGPDLRVPGRPEIAVIGDAALALGRDGKPLPGLAPVAKQQGKYVARGIQRRLRGRPAGGPFRYSDYGELATIGRNNAVADFGRVRLSGFAGWITWAVAHIFFLIGFRNRLFVAAQWAFAYATHDRADRLIVPAQPPVAKPG